MHRTILRNLSFAALWFALLPTSLPAQTNRSTAPRREVFGYSVKQRPLVAYVFGDGRNVTMILGAFHDDEPASPQVVEALRRHLEANPEEWAEKTIILVPVTNPDSREARVRVNANGVDLNRNFPGTWEAAGRAARYNPGPDPASEPETRAVIQLVAKYAPSKIVTVHQPFRTLNWNGEKGRLLAAQMSTQNGYPTTGDIGYPTPGSFGSFCERNGIAIVTLEMPADDFSTCWEQNRNALLTAIRAEIDD